MGSFKVTLIPQAGKLKGKNLRLARRTRTRDQFWPVELTITESTSRPKMWQDATFDSAEEADRVTREFLREKREQCERFPTYVIKVESVGIENL